MTEKTMFYGASPKIFQKAKRLRDNMTRHEKMLWERLRSNQIMGMRFKPQHPISVFIADFYSHKLRLVIEIDGSSHLGKDQIEYDLGRTHEMKNLGLKVIRFTNGQIEHEMSKVIVEIKEHIIERKV